MNNDIFMDTINYHFYKVIIAFLLLTACNPAKPQSGLTDAISTVSKTISPMSVDRTESAVIEETPDPFPSASQQTTPLKVSPITVTTRENISPTLPPVVKAFLEATDPGTVNLVTGKVQLIEFFAFWDPTSKSMATVVHGLETQYKDRIHFIYLDVDDPENSQFKNALGYNYPPHFFLIDGEGGVMQQWVGFVKKEEFESTFASTP